MGTETARQMELSCPLDPAVLRVRHLSGTERLGQCFEYALTLYSEKSDVEAEKLLGHHASVRLRCGEQPERYFDGIVCQFDTTGRQGGYWTYRMVLRPWLWLLSRNSDCRVFQRATTLDIFHSILEGYSDKELENRLTYTQKPREYCVQYRESDLAFVSRLFEEDGVYYYFKHANGRHTLVLADSSNAHEPISGYEKLGLRRSDDEKSAKPMVYRWRTAKRIQAGIYTHTDYDFTKPNATLLSQRSDPQEHTNAEAELFDYPGLYSEVATGTDLAAVRMEQIVAAYSVSEGSCDAAGLSAGALFSLTASLRDADNHEYLVTSASYDADSGGFETGSHEASSFGMAMSAIDSTITFRPPRRTPAPVIVGAQTATVVGPKGNEIWTDKYGRVKVQFHWDRRGKHNEDSSCFVRVAQPWTGSKWGAQFVPRVGQEVTVEFLEGTPDRPLITGMVYNANNPPPFALPSKQTQSGFKTQSTPKGSESDYNELRFDDDKGHEEIHVQAQRDLTMMVKHDSAAEIGHDASWHVKNNVSVSVAEGDHDTTVAKGAMRAEVKESLYGVTAKEVAVSASDAITLRVGDVSIRLDKTSITLTVDKNAEIKLDLADLSIVGTTTVNINPPGVVPMGAAKLPDLLTRMCSPEAEADA